MNIYTKNTPLSILKQKRMVKRMLWDVQPDYTLRVICILVAASVVLLSGYMLLGSALAEEAIQPGDSVRVQCRVNVRDGAGTEYPVYTKLDWPDIVDVVEVVDNWALVKFSSQKDELGWVCTDYLRIIQW